MQKVKVVYLDGTSEVLEGTITILNGCFKIEHPQEEDPTAIIATVGATDSVYIPLTSVKKLLTV